MRKSTLGKKRVTRVLRFALLVAVAIGASETWAVAAGGGTGSELAGGENVELVGQIGGVCNAVAVQGDYAYIGEGTGLGVLDISRAEKPKAMGKVLLSDVVQDLTVSGPLAYAPAGVSGLEIIAYVPCQVTSPNGGEEWKTGSSQTIRWSWPESAVSNVRIRLTRNANSSSPDYETLVASTPNDGSWGWTVTEPKSSYCKISVSDAAGVAGGDSSDNYFKIIPYVPCQVTSPNGGEEWKTDTTQTISWSWLEPAVTNVRIRLTRNANSSSPDYETLVDSTANDGSWGWTVTGPKSSYCKISVSDAAGVVGGDSSDAYFKIIEYIPCEVTSPNGGEEWKIDSSQTIRWSWPESSVSNVRIRLTRNANSSSPDYETLVASTPNDGSWGWTVAGPKSSYCKISVSDAAGVAEGDSSDAYFKIIEYIPCEVTSPNGGEEWKIASSQTIRWSWSESSVSNVRIRLTRNANSSSPDYETLVASTPNDGSWGWTVTGPKSSYCKISVSDAAGVAEGDSSDAYFIIGDISPQVTSPNGGEEWKIGSSQTIRWDWPESSVSNVRVRLTRNANSSSPDYETLVASTPNNGSWGWTVTGPKSSYCKISVSDAAGVAGGDSSDSYFKIIEENVPPEVTINAPADGATVSGNVDVVVTAVDPEDGGASKIEYYVNGILKYTDYSPDVTSPSSQWGVGHGCGFVEIFSFFDRIYVVLYTTLTKSSRRREP